MVTAARNDIKSESSLTEKISVQSSRHYTAASTNLRLTNDKLRELDVIGSLHENDLFKICVKTLQKSQIAQVLTLQVMKSEDGMTDLSTDILMELCYKAFYRAWGSYTKYLRSIVLDKGNVIHCSILGTFSLVSNLEDKTSGVSEKQICYAPTIDLINQFGFKHDNQRIYNLVAQNFKEVKYRHIFSDDKLNRVNYVSIAQAAQMSEVQLMFILRQILMAIETAMRKDYYVKLNVRVGFLKFKQNVLHFENLVSQDEIDRMTHTSCNTAFVNNKKMMTTFKTQRAQTNLLDGDESITKKSISLKDTISRIATPKTPQTKSFHSVFSNSERHQTIQNPNQLNQRLTERKARKLNTLVDLGYGKRFHIAGKDKHQDVSANKMLQNDIILQRIAKEELKNLDKLVEKEDALDIISQIKDSLEQATVRKHNILYKQKNVVHRALQQQIEERQQQKLSQKQEAQQASHFFPFKSDEEFATKQAAIKRTRNHDMKVQLQKSIKEQEEYQLKRRQEVEQAQIEDSRVKSNSPRSTQVIAFESGRNVMQEAFRRYELKMQKQNADRLREISDISKDVEKIQIEDKSNVFLKNQKLKLLGKTLEQQLEEKRVLKIREKVDGKAFIKPHFGPEDPDPHLITELNKKRAVETAEVITKQIKEKNEKLDLLKKVQLLEEVRAVKINDLVIQHEDEIASEHEKLKKQVLREAWEEQQRMRHEKDVQDYKYYKLLQ